MQIHPACHHACCRVKTYEKKVAALSAINSGLQKENDKLRKDLAHRAMPTTDAGANSRTLLLCYSSSGAS